LARLLVVDDEAADRLVMKTILERAGHEVFVAGDGREALELYEGKGIEVVITDLQMKGVHGLELITIIRDFDPRPPIIAVSGTGEVQLDMAQALGAGRALTKPIRPDELLAAVVDLLVDAD
jgi:CheY-like chemotaxis protein